MISFRRLTQLSSSCSPVAATSFRSWIPINSSYSTITNEITLTDICKQMIEKKSKNTKFLRLLVDSGEGCGGFVYKFSFDEVVTDEDFVYKTPQDKILFACDGLTLNFVKGATLSFEQDMMRSAFYVQVNPNAEKECSCKVSFSPKESVFQQ